MHGSGTLYAIGCDIHARLCQALLDSVERPIHTCCTGDTALSVLAHSGMGARVLGCFYRAKAPIYIFNSYEASTASSKACYALWVRLRLLIELAWCWCATLEAYL